MSVIKGMAFDYSKFDQVCGDHPLKESVPDSFIEYNVRKRHGGKVAFFNFELAREMGLLPEGHPDKITQELEHKILETFSIVIINEYDLIHKTPIKKSEIKPNKYMATRYLQLQHPSRVGKTSGDGRSIWNGAIKHKGKTWDITSCGTGATRLSPATNINKKFYKTGDPTISYGCGHSEVDEGISTLFFSEIMSRNGIETERVLGIIEFKNGISINIRAHQNLIRPSHFFRFLKLGDYKGLKAMMDYYIEREISNKNWKGVPSKGKPRYDFFLKKITESFARTVARFENEYLFCWLDWDGDNILTGGGIIDYGSVRLFGLFHHEYRYDDVERFSTTILEQKEKARYIVQTFKQAVDFVVTKKKKRIETFKKDKILSLFDKEFITQKNLGILYKIGFTTGEQNILLHAAPKKIEAFKKAFSYFERAKSSRGIIKVSDGITCNAIFCMRDILRELPQIYQSRNDVITAKEFIEIIKSSYGTKKDLANLKGKEQQVALFQKNYFDLIRIAAKRTKRSFEDLMLDICTRASVINKYDRITGDSVLHITQKVIHVKPKLNCNEIYDLMRQFSGFLNFTPEKERSISIRGGRQKKYIGGMLKIVRENREGL